MMGIQEMLLALLLTVFGGTSGNEVLDYVDADIYFKSKGVQMGVDAMMLEAKKPDIGEDAFTKEASVRRLLAIRVLGDLKDKKALVVLNSFTSSKEMFVSDYAKRAIAKIEEKPFADNKEDIHQWRNNIALLPKETGVVINMRPDSLGGKPGLMHRILKMKKTGLLKGMENMSAEIEKGMIDDFYPVIDRIGNARIDSITIAVAENVGGNNGWITGIINGLYDKQAVMNYVNQELADDMILKKVGSGAYFLPEDTLAYAFQDDYIVNFAAGPSEELLPLEEMQTLIDSKNQKTTFSERLETLIKKTNKKGGLWIAGLVTGEMLNVPFAREFETLRVETESDGNTIECSIIGEAKDAKTLKETMTKLEKLYTQFKDNELEEGKKNAPKPILPMLKAFESLVFKTQEDEGIIMLEAPIVDPLEIIFGMYMSFAAVPMEAEVQPKQLAPAE